MKYKPRLGTAVVLSMNRGRRMEDKKKQAQKWACRKSKNLRGLRKEEV